MLLASCGAVLDDDAILECAVWIEQKVAQGQRVVFLFEDIATHAAVANVIPPTPNLHCVRVDGCTSSDTFVVFGALYATVQAAPPTDLLRFTGKEFESLTPEAQRISQLNRLFAEIDVALKSGEADRAKGALGMLRDTLAAHSGILSAKVYQRAGECKLLIDACRARHLVTLQDGSLLVRSRMKPLETWMELLPLLDISGIVGQLAGWPEVGADLARLHAFVNSGRTALASDAAIVKQGKLPTLSLMLWLAAYLVRVSEHYYERGDGAAAIAVCVGALETYARFRLFEMNVLDFDVVKTDLRRTSTGLTLFAKYKSQGYGDGVQGAVMVLADTQVLGAIASISDILEVVQLRNQSALAHGVQRLSSNDAEQAVKRVKTFIKQAEAKTPNVGPRWNNLLTDSFVLDWTTLGSNVFQGLLS